MEKYNISTNELPLMSSNDSTLPSNDSNLPSRLFEKHRHLRLGIGHRWLQAEEYALHRLLSRFLRRYQRRHRLGSRLEMGITLQRQGSDRLDAEDSQTAAR